MANGQGLGGVAYVLESLVKVIRLSQGIGSMLRFRKLNQCSGSLLGDAFKIQKKNRFKLSQKEGGGPEQIAKFVRCEIGT